MIEGICKTIGQARTVVVARTLADDIGSWTRSSRVGRSVGDLIDRVERYHDSSLIHSAVDTGLNWIEASWGYRWLTAGPDPDVIVIDLRDTLSVGPVIALLDAALDFLFPAFDYSIVSRTTDRTVNMLRAAPIKTVGLVTLVSTTVLLPLAVIAIDSSIAVVIAGVGVVLIAALGTQIEMSWDEVVETRAVRLIIALLEPPSPPEQNSEHNATADISLTTDQRTSETESED